MHKMLVILGSFALAGAAWASDVPDRSALSYEENAIINQACSPALQQSVSAFHACVARQVASLKDHPTPDRSGLSVARNRAIENGCSYLKREGIGPYNDCVRKAMTVAEKPPDNPNVDDLVPNYTKVFTDDATKAADAPAAPKPTPAAATALPSPAAALPKRPDHLEQKPLSPEEIYKKVERSVFVVLASPSLAEVKAQHRAGLGDRRLRPSAADQLPRGQGPSADQALAGRHARRRDAGRRRRQDRPLRDQDR